MDRSPVTFLFLMVLAVLGIGYFVQKKTHPEGSATTDPAVLASDFGKVETAINAAKGKVVLVDCWATWCPPCRSSFPKLVEKHDKYAAKGLVVMAVSVDEPSNADSVKEFLQQQNATFQNFMVPWDGASGKGLHDRLGLGSGIPHAALFNRNGERVWDGHPEDPELETKLQAALNN
ncbi:MAG: TlpA family protein disulfide reductase [Planctomycetes bacterium]|nr:TlpA family protein disulfide reductase [Planctomycetota bacterium]